jgi:predicted Zn finger-like uncharacterized protein
MIISCPDCRTRYRIKDVAPGRSDTRLLCPNCKFHFTLIAPRTERQTPTTHACAKVLVVDDAHFFREMLVDLLMPLNLNMAMAATATEALEQLRQQPFNLILLDLNLPDKNGLELIAEIRSNNQLHNTRILAMSGVYRREADGLDAIRAGADSFLIKSFRPDDLREKVRKLLL